MKRLAVAALLVVGSCIPDPGPMMSPYQDCLSCHSGADAPGWTAAGTWYKGTKVTVTDANGKSVTMRGNQAGNFYTAEGLALPITIAVDGVLMATSTAPTTPIRSMYGGCNACHQAWAVITGPKMAPGSNCLASGCHSPGGAGATFVAAGTFLPGSAVTVGSCPPKVTNSAGNFYIRSGECTIPSWPSSAAVSGRTMEGGAPRGGCNDLGVRCHDSRGSAGGGN